MNKMSKIKLKFDNRLDGNIIIAVYPKPENYKSVVLKAIESEQKIPAVNEVFDLEKSIDLFLQEFHEKHRRLKLLSNLLYLLESSNHHILVDERLLLQAVCFHSCAKPRHLRLKLFHSYVCPVGINDHCL